MSGGTISSAVQRVLGLSDEPTLGLARQTRNTSFSTLVRDGGRFSLASFNAVPHLELENDAALMTVLPGYDSGVAHVFSHPATRRILLALAGTALVAWPRGAAPEARQDPAIPAPAAAIDIVALDREGRFVDNLRAADFAVTVDGARRPVLWVRRVSRGPGAMADAASRQVRPEAGVLLAAEAERTVLVVIDQASILRGDERSVVEAAGAFLDRLGLDDRVAVLRIPLTSDATVALTTERPEARAALARVAGLILPAPLVTAPVEPVSDLEAEKARMTGLEPETPNRVAATLSAAPPGGEGDPRTAEETLGALRAVFDTLSRMPGRKTVAVFSAGLPSSANALVDETALSAASAHAVVYGFGVRASSAAAASGLLTAEPIERLAAATGGAFVQLGRNIDRAIERAANALGACYVLGLEPAPQDIRGARHRLRAETTRNGVTVRAGAWLVPVPDAGDEVPATSLPAAAAEPAEAAVPDRAPAVRPLPLGADLQVALARLFGYADGYERQYSMLVAEEDYRQSAPQGGIRLRSDLLLVRPDPASEWVSFRDVFEVDGNPVRDREERLHRLFLDGSPQALARLAAIRDESARYNAGPVERTVNVPLLPLSFLRPANRGRFDYELAGRDQAGGVQAWRIHYTERARPTLVADRQHNDVPVSGWFLVDTVTGAVVETRMDARRDDARAQIMVRYRRDPMLGLWVPAEMKEAYSQPESRGSGRWGIVSRVTLEGRATYSNFRRFQVKTEEKVTLPK